MNKLYIIINTYKTMFCWSHSFCIKRRVLIAKQTTVCDILLKCYIKWIRKLCYRDFSRNIIIKFLLYQLCIKEMFNIPTLFCLKLRNAYLITIIEILFSNIYLRYTVESYQVHFDKRNYNINNISLSKNWLKGWYFPLFQRKFKFIFQIYNERS